MKFHAKKLLTISAAVALTFAVAACSSNGDDDEVAATDPTVGEPVAPAACEGTEACLAEAMTNLEAAKAALAALEASDDSTLGEVAAARVAVTDAETALTTAQTAHDEYLAMQPDPVPSVTELFVTAQASSDAAVAAGAAAAKAVKDATDASKLTTMQVNGDSMVATANAQAILDARDAAAKAVMDAQTALGNAMAAMVHAAALDDDDASKVSLVAALEAAIMVAESHLKAATDHRDGDTLKVAVEMVTGADPEAEGYPTTPADLGRVVAMAIGEALGGELDTDGIARGTTGAVPDPEVMNEVAMNDHQGHTWAEIVGAANISKLRIATSGTDTDEVDAASIAGMTAASVNTALTDDGGVDSGNTYADGSQTANSTYNGIPGTAICAGSDCEVDEDGKLAGSWFFTPTDGAEWYLGMTDDEGVTTYIVETMYAQFGHWLTIETDGAAINRYAMSGVTDDGDLTTVGNDENGLAGSATYVGPAAGMSVYKTVNSDSTINTIDSAAFTATVNLKATFGASPTLGGTVTDFVGDAVGDWTVELQSTGFDGELLLTEGTTVASGRNGDWSATSYGEATARPTGIYGLFNAHFLDGHAAGAYATRQE